MLPDVLWQSVSLYQQERNTTYWAEVRAAIGEAKAKYYAYNKIVNDVLQELFHFQI